MEFTITTRKGVEFTVLYDDEDRGLIEPYKWHITGAKHPYVARWEKQNGKNIRIRLYRSVTGIMDMAVEVDHKNKNTLDNRKENLRECSRIENARNRNGWSASGYLGVFMDSTRKGFRVAIKYNGKQRTKGRFSDVTEAAKFYDKLALKYFGEFANLNFKEEIK